jgi:hypothetical protein
MRVDVSGRLELMVGNQGFVFVLELGNSVLREIQKKE